MGKHWLVWLPPGAAALPLVPPHGAGSGAGLLAPLLGSGRAWVQQAGCDEWLAGTPLSSGAALHLDNDVTALCAAADERAGLLLVWTPSADGAGAGDGAGGRWLQAMTATLPSALLLQLLRPLQPASAAPQTLHLTGATGALAAHVGDKRGRC